LGCCSSIQNEKQMANRFTKANREKQKSLPILAISSAQRRKSKPWGPERWMAEQGKPKDKGRLTETGEP
jgi:hypothetical protein